MFFDSCEKAVFHYVHQQPRGVIFAMSDFKELGTYDAIRQAVSRLARRKILERLAPGIYWVSPHVYSEDPIEPDFESIAYALARNYNWTILPGTELARYMLGISLTPPKEPVYFSTGPTNTYPYRKNRKLRMSHNASRFFGNMPESAALVVSALIDLDNHKVTAAEVHFLSQSLSEETKEALINNLPLIPARLRPVIEIICDCYGRASR